MPDNFTILAQTGNIKSGLQLMKDAAEKALDNSFFMQELDVSGSGPAIDELYEIDAAYRSLWEAVNLLYANTISFMESLANNLESIDASAVNNCDTEG